jgi:Ca-activated chloride channel family protein
MFRFENSIYLWLLCIIPIMAMMRYSILFHQQRKMRNFGDPELVNKLMPDVSKLRKSVKFWILMSVLALFIIILARPQIGSKMTSQNRRKGINAIIALDISNSMMAEDVVPSRLEKSKMLIENMVDNFYNDKVGLIVFAGDAFVQLPITSDYVSAKMFLQEIQPSLITTQGTDIARAIHLAINSCTQQDETGKAIIVITDGEDHEGGAMEAAAEAKDKGFRVFILGVGSPNGAKIPANSGGYMKDNTGNDVITALNEDMCKQIASAGSGTYIHVDNTGDAQKKLDNELSKMQKGEISSAIYSDYDEQFQAVAIIALVLLILEICILERKNPLSKRITLFKRKNIN